MRGILLAAMVLVLPACDRQTTNYLVWGPKGGPPVGGTAQWVRDCTADRFTDRRTCRAKISFTERVPYPYDFVSVSMLVEEGGGRWWISTSTYEEWARIRIGSAPAISFRCDYQSACEIRGPAAERLSDLAASGAPISLQVSTYHGLVDVDLPSTGFAAIIPASS